ncbi:MAG: hypothetical protein P8163_19120 [Candidatus Thiodiazotropha sp.]
MSYVDLNPIRAKLADRPETSDFTSIQDCIRNYKQKLEQTGDCEEVSNTGPHRLIPFIGGEHHENASGLNFSLPDYLELTDRAGRDISEDKSGAIHSNLAQIAYSGEAEHLFWVNVNT